VADFRKRNELSHAGHIQIIVKIIPHDVVVVRHHMVEVAMVDHRLHMVDHLRMVEVEADRLTDEAEEDMAEEDMAAEVTVEEDMAEEDTVEEIEWVVLVRNWTEILIGI